MTIDEAKAECRRWLAHLDRQRERTREWQRAAALARAGKIDEAHSLRRKLDAQPRVYDGANLERAVIVLLEAECLSD